MGVYNSKSDKVNNQPLKVTKPQNIIPIFILKKYAI